MTKPLVQAWNLRARCTGLNRVPEGAGDFALAWLTARPSECRTFAVVYAFAYGTAKAPQHMLARALVEAGAGDIEVQACRRALDVEFRAAAIASEALEEAGRW